MVYMLLVLFLEMENKRYKSNHEIQQINRGSWLVYWMQKFEQITVLADKFASSMTL